MKFLIYRIGDEREVGVLCGDGRGIIPLKTLGLHYMDMMGVIENIGEVDLEMIREALIQGKASFDIDDVKIETPIKKTRHDIICVGLNYKKHYEETREDFAPKDESRARTIYFSKRATETIGYGDTIVIPEDLDRDIDYEAELAVIVGKRGKRIKKEEAEDYIFGYTVLNDVSARSLQKGHSQWYLGKSVDTFTAMGPFIVHRSALPMPFDLRISSTLNDEVRQDSRTTYMMKGVAEIISEISQGITLEPGDIIATGTPEGVGMGFTPPRYMKSGDTIVCEIEGIGSLKNTIL